MKFLVFLAFTAAASVFAAPAMELEPRAKDAITDALAPVTQSLKSLDTAIKGLSSDPMSALPLLNASDDASKSLSGAAGKIQAADNLSLTGALGLQQTATGLVDQVTTTIGDLTAKKDVLDMLGVTSVAVQALQSQKSASGGLSTALLSKVPAIAKPIAKMSTDQISKALDDGIAMLMAGGKAQPAAAAAAAPAAAPAAE